jgi:hypothetical protein
MNDETFQRWQTVAKTLAEAAALGASFRISGTEVRMRSESPLPATLIEQLQQHRHLLREYLRQRGGCRCGGIPRSARRGAGPNH